MINKLEKINERYKELAELIVSPEVIADNKNYTKLAKEYSKKRVLAGPTEGTAVGNLLTQIISAGEIKDLQEGRIVVKNSFKVVEVE
jgi:rhamnulokinase